MLPRRALHSLSIFQHHFDCGNYRRRAPQWPVDFKFTLTINKNRRHFYLCKQFRSTQRCWTVHLKDISRETCTATALSFEAFNAVYFPCDSVLSTSAESKHRHAALQSPKAEVLSQGPSHNSDFGWWRCVPLSTPTWASPSVPLSSTLPPD